ncbi:hypothetical protein TWF970_002755 [Orbilia oligospora]|uniref:Uncharacterized protein n=1 Tax=Orbilia oligospora TaxID=2813651 RepID=A0A7C8VQD3_ORBOL|nr:hypothetical protein TWF970_002755 [Orbilia oligospora]
MHFSTLFTAATVALVGFIDVASGHVVFIDAWGSTNPAIHGHGLGYGYLTPRKGTHLVPFQRDVAVFDDRVVHHWGNKKYRPNGCGCSVQSSANWYAANNKSLWVKKGNWLFNEITPAAAYINVRNHINHLSLLESKGSTRNCISTGRKGLKNGIPKVAAGKTLTIIAHQVNLDGGGPFHCKIDYKGVGQSWTRNLEVVSCRVNGKLHKGGKNCPGDPNSSFSWHTVGKRLSFQLVMPANLNCQGKYGANGKVLNICLVRCENKAANGPFGGCVPVQQVRPTVRVVTKKVGNQKVTSKVPIKPASSRKIIIKPQTVRTTIVKVVKVPIKPTGKPAPPRVRVVVVTARDTIIYVYRGPNNTRVPSKVKKGAVVTVTETIPAPTVTTVTTTVVEQEVFEDEVVEKGNDDDDGEDGEVEDGTEDAGNDIGGKNGTPDQKPTEEEVEAAIGGEDISEEEKEKLKEEKVSDENKELLDEADKNKDETMEDHPEDTSYFKRLRMRRA